MIEGPKYAGSNRVKKIPFEDMILSPIILIGTFSCFLPPPLPQKMNAAVTKGSFEAHNTRTIVFLPQTTSNI